MVKPKNMSECPPTAPLLPFRPGGFGNPLWQLDQDIRPPVRARKGRISTRGPRLPWSAFTSLPMVEPMLAVNGNFSCTPAARDFRIRYEKCDSPIGRGMHTSGR
jgi:hypothetical protein